jgi:exosortase C (VPDSG-CTERM-specific)
VLLLALGKQLIWFTTSVLDSDLNSYIILIPLVSLYLLYVNRDRLARNYESGFGLAVLPSIIGAAGVVFFFVVRATRSWSSNDRTSLFALALVCLIWSGGLMFMGKRWMASAAFPMLFLGFFIPLPDQLVHWMEMGLRIASAQAADFFFAISGTPVMKTGTVFQLPGMTIEVAQECSGIRSSWVLFITSLVAAQLFLTRTWSRLVLVAVVIPLGILRNGFRIMVIGLLCVHVDPNLIHSAIHHRGGPIFFSLSLIPLLLILWFLRRREIAAEESGVMVHVEA